MKFTAKFAASCFAVALALPAPAAAQVQSAFPSANQVYAGPTTGSPARPSFRALGIADVPSIATLLAGGPLTINPTAATLTQGLVINQSGPTSGSQAGTSTNCAGQGQQSFAYNSICITSEQANITGGNPSYTIGAAIAMVTGGANSQGQKNALGVQILHNSASAPSTTRDHVAVQAFAVGSAGDGGTNTGAGSAGTLFGAGFAAHALSGATNLTAVVGAEFDTQIESGATAKWRFGVSSVGGGSVRGAAIDAAYEIGATSASAAFLGGLVFSSIHGGPPVATTGTLIGTDGTSATVANGIDFSAYTISGNFLRGPSGNFTVSGAGAITAAGPAVIGHTAALTTSAGGVTPNLQVHGTTTSTITQSITSWVSGSGGAILTLAKSRSGTIGTTTIVQSGDTIGIIAFQGDDANGSVPNFVNSARITAVVDGTPGVGDMPGRLIFSTAPDGSVTLAARQSIYSDGGVGFGAGTTSPGAGVVKVEGTTDATSSTTGIFQSAGGVGVAKALWVGTYVATTPVAVASLPSCAAGTQGARMFVTDSNAASFTAGIGAVVAAGGATKVPVTCDGTNWRIGANDNIPAHLMRKFA